MKEVIIRYRWSIIFIASLLWMSWLYGTFDTMNRGPYSRHQWRQTDCLSITSNYSKDSVSFLEPEIHQQNGAKTGKTISELPIVYYTIGKVWSFTGRHYWMYRLSGFLIFVIGLIYLRRTLLRILDDPFWATFTSLFLFASPVIVYFSNNFLMDTFALGLALIGISHLHHYYIKKKYKYLLLGCALFLFAGLLKITSLLLFFGIGGVVLFNFLRRRLSKKDLLTVGVPFVSALLLIFSWLVFVNHYNSKHLSGIFLQGILPIWEISEGSRVEIWKSLWNVLMPEIYNTPTLSFLAGIFILIVVNFKKANQKLLQLAVFVLVQILVFFLLFFQVFDVHEYYLINLILIVPLVIVLGLELLKTHYPAIFNSKKTKLIAGLGLICCIYYAAVHTRIKYDAGNSWVKSSFLFSSEKASFWEYYHYDYKQSLMDLETIEPYLNEIGCTPDKIVVSIPDVSINVSLYLMNRKGFTDYGYSDWVGAKRIEMAKKHGAQFLIINRKQMLEEPYLQKYLTNKVGETEFVTIFQL